ncbi:unnamed protein product [Caenorhabditis brenneri]
MESRKRKSELELYIDTLTDPPEKQRKSNEFYNSLKLFYKRRWNAQLKLPCVQGVEVNLYRLYDTVMALGGWQKVAHADKWSDIAEMFGCKDDIVCGDHAIKLIYMRYLSKFEQVETIGDVDDYVDNEMSRSRGRNATSFFATNDCPISYNRMHPEQPPRDERGQIITDPDYARLTKSLISGLPNEVDFAMNVSMLLSHSGPKQLRLCHAPTLMTLLVAHTGVYDEDDKSLMELGEDWKKTTRHNYRKFWASSGVPLDILMRFLDREIESEYIDTEEDAQFFTGVSDTFNVKDPRCWRLNQVTTIIRNLSFEPANRVTIVKTWPVMKFLIMCASCKWSPLYVAALDALSNLATDIDLADKTLVHISQHAILRIINDGIFSRDKFKLMRAMEILTGLCGFEGNEAIICDWLKSDTISHIFEIVGVKDIMMCVYTLECLYQISEMGDTACDLISESSKAIQQLVSMATLEAVSFGPAGLAGMKVVEYQPSFTQAPPPQQPPQQFMQRAPMGPGPSHAPMQQAPPPQTPYPPRHLPQEITVKQAVQNQLALQQVQRENAQRAEQQTTVPPSTSSSHRQNRSTIVPVRAIGPSSSESPEDRLVRESTVQWIQRNTVFDRNSSAARTELFSTYVDDMRSVYDVKSGGLDFFCGIIKYLHPEVLFKVDGDKNQIMAVGIRVIRPNVLAPAGSSAATRTSESHPLMARMLNNSERPAENGVMVNGTGRRPPTPPQQQSNGDVQSEEDSKSSDDVVETKVKPILTNGTIEVCQEPIQASQLFEDEENNGNGTTKTMKMEASEVQIEIREQHIVMDTDAIKSSVRMTEDSERPTTNGVILNGHAAPRPNNRRATVASRAADLVAAVAACNGDLERLNGTVPAAENGREEEPKKEEAEPEDPAPESGAPEPSSSSSTKKPVPTASKPTDYMCDWDCCSKFYGSPAHTLKHLAEEHVVVEEIHTLCRWNGCTDPTPRNRWSLITHVQDSHCNETQLKLSAQQRKDGTVIPRGPGRDVVVPRDMNNHPGYAKNAAFDAIRRHAFNYLSRELTDEAEGPVTKSIRLTSCLILRNLARYSADGRQKLRRHESHICWLALSRLESSHALSQLLSELHQTPADAEDDQQQQQPLKSLSAAPSSASLSSLGGNGGSSSSQLLPTIPESPTATSVTTPSFLKKPSVAKPSTAPVNRMLNFSSLSVPTEKPSTSSSSSSSASAQFSTGGPSVSAPPRHHPIQQHMPTQPSPLVQTTTPVRAGAGN